MRRCLLLPCILLACGDSAAPSGSAVALSRDARGVPRMIRGNGMRAAGTPMQAARAHVERLAPEWGVVALPELVPIDELAAPGGTVARMKQVIDGVPVWGGELRVLVRDGELALASGRLVGLEAPRSHVMRLDEGQAIARALRPGEVAERSLARRVWYPSGSALIAAWAIDMYTSRADSTHGDAHRTLVAGDDGRVLEHYTLVADAEFSYNVFAEPTGEKHPLDSPLVDATPHATGTPDGSFPQYLAGPTLVTVDGLNHPAGGGTDPWLPTGATATVGNNVDAYVDITTPDGLTAGDFRASATGTTFGHAYDTSVGPMVSTQQQMAAVTSLFYVINWLHDFWYDAGFTEAAGNAQHVNHGRGGVEGDRLLAEAQDNANGGSRNNANMTTPDDGLSPRMQVYLWTGKDERTMSLAPSGRAPRIGGASFGPKDYDLTAPLMIGDDGATPDPKDGCTALTSSATDKIVMVVRGNCTFERKALNIQNAGGVGMLLVNNTTSTSPPGMGDDETLEGGITIPSVSVTQAEGATIAAEVEAGTVTATVHRRVAHELDGALDATLIAHEFGHYLHHRLSLCGKAMCRAMSEGWGDFTSLMLLARAGDDLDGAYPFSVYTTQGYPDDPAYYGIRRAPYSVDPAINALTFGHMADGAALPTTHPILPSLNNAEVHNAGEIWASALWEVYVSLQKAGGSFDDVRAKMARYVVAGLAMTPVEPTALETRDAMLAVADPADQPIMLAAFARRGFGSCAVAPPDDSVDFQEIVESSLIAGNAQLTTSTLADNCDEDGVLDTGETARLTLQVANRGHAKLTNLSLSVASALPGVAVVSPPVAVPELAPGATTDLNVDVTLAEGITDAIAGDLTLVVASEGGCAASVEFPLAARLNIDDRDSASPIDSFDTAVSGWAPWTAAWRHVRESPLDGAWYGENLAIISDTRLTSPFVTAHATEPVTLTFTHRHEFEFSSGKAWDGAVIEYSIGNDEVWHDLSTIATVPYNGSLTVDSGNALEGRNAFASTNPSNPNPDVVTIDLGTALAGQSFRIRFRIGTDSGTGARGWEIDDVGFTGIVGTPFAAQVPDDGNCDPVEDPDDPVLSGGGGGCCAAGSLGDSSVLALGTLALVLRRRRRR